MKFVRLLMTIFLFISLSAFCVGEENIIVNLLETPDAHFEFDADQPILEIVFPRVFSSDCTIIRFGEKNMLVDASTDSPDMHERIKRAIDWSGLITLTLPITPTRIAIIF